MTLKDKQLYVPAWIRIINFIHRNPGTYSLEVSKRLDVTYSQVLMLLGIFKIYKWVNAKYEGSNTRIKRLYITSKGISSIKNLGIGPNVAK